MKFITGDPIPQPSRFFTVQGSEHELSSELNHSHVTGMPRVLGVELDGYQDALMLAARLGVVVRQGIWDMQSANPMRYYRSGEERPSDRPLDAIQLQVQLLKEAGQRDPEEPFGLVAPTVRMGEILRSASYVSDETVQKIGDYMLRDDVHDPWVAHVRGEFSPVIPDRSGSSII